MVLFSYSPCSREIEKVPATTIAFGRPNAHNSVDSSNQKNKNT